MKKKVLIVIDMQVDFVTGALANVQAQQIVPKLRKKIDDYVGRDIPVLFTRDTHGEDYLHTQEGRLLPVPHCIKGSNGWQIIPELRDAAPEEVVLDKPAFGSLDVPMWVCEKLGGVPEEIELAGVCTDICVISNAMVLKAAFPETTITIDGSCCAGVSEESHRNALAAMAACQMRISGEMESGIQ